LEKKYGFKAGGYLKTLVGQPRICESFMKIKVFEKRFAEDSEEKMF
jgi:hypothetical protein